MEDKIPATFIRYAADILADTEKGMSGYDIVKEMTAYAAEYDVQIPHTEHPFKASNKRSALYDCLMKFSGAQQYRIIKELSEYRRLDAESEHDRRELRTRLAARFHQFSREQGLSDINETLISETRHWLDGFSSAKTLFEQALSKYDSGGFRRNLLDDLRLSLESLLRELFENQKSLEKQIPEVGQFVKSQGGSPEFVNMFHKLVEYYSKYQNTYVKHNDSVIEEEVEFIFEITASLMKHIIRLHGKNV